MKSWLILPACLLLTACALATPAQTAALTPDTPIPTPTETPTATVVPTDIVTEGSELANAGVPVGLEIRVRGQEIFAVNLVGQEVKVGENINGKIEPAYWLKYKLASAPEEATKPEYFIPMEDVLAGVPSLVAKLHDAQLFPEGIVTGQDVVMTSPSDFRKKLAWSPEAEKFYSAHPELVPYVDSTLKCNRMK